MYRKSNKSSATTLFYGTQSLLKGKSLKIYEDEQNWHNLFRKHVTERIDEDIFSVLYCSDFGAPNAPVRVLVSMMILKEAQGWSDSQLFEACLFNLLVRSALGLCNIDDLIPACSTYYLFRKNIVDWENKGNENLLEKVFAQVTKSQFLEFKINGNKIRMDSKLLGSNIAWYSRYELIHETVRKVYDKFPDLVDSVVSEADIVLLKRISGESGDKVCYRSNSTEIESKLTELGIVIHKIISQINDNSSKSFQTLRRVFNEQYQLVDDEVSTRSKHEISATSVQSPHDTDCHYRNKDGNQVKGYSINITETCNSENAINLITDVIVEAVSAADCEFLQSAIESTQEVVCTEIETVNADGAYHSVANQDYCKENDIDLVVSAIQGKPSRYDLATDQNNDLVVTDLANNTNVPVRKVESRKENAEPKWAIQTSDNKHRYFTQKDIDTCLLRKRIASRSLEELNLRNNVEASIFQLGYHYSNDKSRYRGIIKHKMWANVRCMWVNFVRISKFIRLSGPNYAQMLKKQAILVKFMLKYVKSGCCLAPVRNFLPRWGENRDWEQFLKKDFL